MAKNRDIEKIAQDVPGVAGANCTDDRARLLFIQELLRTSTNAEEGLKLSEIAEIWAARSGAKKPATQTISDDVHAIADNQPFGMQIKIPGRGEVGGIRCTSRALSKEQISTLMTLVKASQFFTKEDCDSLIEGLASLNSAAEQSDDDFLYIDQRRRPNEPDVLAALSTILDAMKQGRKIRYRYMNWDLDNNEHFKTNRLDGTEWYEETPVNLIFSFENYYVEVLRKSRTGKDFKPFALRLDRIRDVSVSDLPAEETEQVIDLQKTVTKRTRETFDMFGDETERAEVFLAVEPKFANVIYSRFGDELKFEHVEHDENGNATLGYLRLSVLLAPTFYRWIAAFGTGIRIVEPTFHAWSRTGSWGKAPYEDIDIANLKHDYKRAIEGYKQFLAEASSWLPED